MFLNVATAAPVVNLGSINGVGVPAGTTFFGEEIRSAYLGLIPRGQNPGTRNQTRVSPDFHNPYTQQWSFGVQRQIGSKMAAEVRYAGAHTVGEFETFNGNPRIDRIPAALVPAGVVPCTSVPATDPRFGRENCAFGNVRVRGNGAFVIYHGLQTRLDIQNWHGLIAGVNYTYSKALDNVSEVFARTGGAASVIPQNPFDNNRAERAVSATSFPNVFTTYWAYELPWHKNQAGLVGRMFGGWELAGAYRFQSGEPFNPTENTVGANLACDPAFNNAFIGIDACRPILGNPSAPLDSAGRFTNTTGTSMVSMSCPVGSAITPTGVCALIPVDSVHWIRNDNNAASIFGSPFLGIGRNILRGQTRNNLDFSVFKSFKMTETTKLRLQADVFNIFNRQYRGVPNSNGINLNNANLAAGGPFMNTATNTSNRRFIQLAARFSF